MPRWHHTSIYGPGPRRPLDREQRARFKFLVKAHRSSGNITADHLSIGFALLQRLGTNGQCDPTHKTLAMAAGCTDRTVRRGLARLRMLGLLRWHRRIVRDGWRVEQTSNAYILAPEAAATPSMPLIRRVIPKGWIPRTGCPPVAWAEVPPPSAHELAAAQAALAARRAVVMARLAGRRVA
jgi:hypothetical protein